MNKRTIRKIALLVKRLVTGYIELALPVLSKEADSSIPLIEYILDLIVDFVLVVFALVVGWMIGRIVTGEDTTILAQMSIYLGSAVAFLPAVRSPKKVALLIWSLIPEGEKPKNNAKRQSDEPEASEMPKRYIIGEDGELVENQYAEYDDKRRFL